MPKSFLFQMKKTLLLFASTFVLGSFAQSSMVLTLHSNGYTITPNEKIYLNTKPNGTSITEVDITNISSSTKLYKVKRSDNILNTDAIAYFCFAGNCFTENIFTSPDADTLGPGQSASELKGDFKLLSADLIEGSTVGLSEIEYKIYDQDNTSDAVIFTLVYNSSVATGIKQNAGNANSLEIFPNPAKEIAYLNVQVTKSAASQLVVMNAIGEVVIAKDIKLNEGKNKINLEIDNLNSGVYFVSIKNGNTSISKKLIIQ